MLRQHVYRNSPFYNYIWEQGRQRQLDSFNTMLDAFGLIPGIGEFADGLNVAIYAARGDKVNAAISTASMVPFLGWAAVSTKYAVKVEAKLLLNQFNSIESLVEGAGKLERLKGGVRQGLIKGDGESIFNAITKNSQPLSNGRFLLNDGTNIGKHFSSTTGDFTINFTKAGQTYKIRVQK